MYCGNCHNKIAKGKSHFKHHVSGKCFCSLDCLNDWLIYSQAITLEINEGEAEDEGDTDE